LLDEGANGSEETRFISESTSWNGDFRHVASMEELFHHFVFHLKFFVLMIRNAAAGDDAGLQIGTHDASSSAAAGFTLRLVIAFQVLLAQSIRR